MLSIKPLTIPAGAAGGAEGIAAYLADGDAQYRSEGGAAPSMWLGDGAQALGLQGAVQAADHVALLQGLHPTTGQPLGQKQHHPDRDMRCGWDFTFSAPKSYSAIWATAAEDEDARAQLEAAHDRAVARAVALVEQTARCRQGKGGKEKVEAAIIAAAHRHSTSRLLDPQVHTHVSLMNIGQRPDGSWGALEVRDLYRMQRTLGAAYRAELAAELRDLGYTLQSDKAAFKIVGVPDLVADRWSQRRHEILDAMGGDTTGQAAAAERAALHTRGAKEHRPAEELHSMWQQQAAEMGWTGELAIPEDFHQASFEEALQAHLDSTWQTHAVLRDRDLQRLVMEAAGHAGVRVDEALQRTQAAQEGLVRLTGQDGEIYWTTPAHLQVSRELRATAQELASSRLHVIPREVIDAQIAAAAARGLTLRPEQEAALRHFADAGDLSLVVGAAGAGKTTAMDAYCSGAQSAGFRVLGLAPSGKAAEQLGQDAHIDARTIHSLLLREQKAEEEGRPSMLDDKTILLVDEAGMLDAKLTRDLLALAKKHGCAVRLVGDDQQVAPVSAGASFRVLARDFKPAELIEHRRQRHAWARDAAKALRAGEAAEALAAYRERGWLHIVETREAAQEFIVGRWAETYDPTDPRNCVLTAPTNADVGALNELARESLRAGGLLDGEAVRWADGPREYSIGDRVLVRKNDRDADVKNGNIGTVRLVSAQLITIELDNGRQVTLQAGAFDAAKLERGYAISVHASQGSTAEHTRNLLAGGNLDKLLAYVQGTRHRESAELVLVASDCERLAALAGVEIDGDTQLTPWQLLEAAAQRMSQASPHEDLADFQVEAEPSAKNEEVEVTSATARLEVRAAALPKTSHAKESKPMSRSPTNPERAQAARAHAAAWYDRWRTTRGQREPSDAELLAWRHLHERASGADLRLVRGPVAPEPPIPDPRQVPEWAARLQDLERARSPAQLQATMAPALASLWGFIDAELEWANEAAANVAGDDRDAYRDPGAVWLEQVLPEPQVAAGAAPSAPSPVVESASVDRAQAARVRAGAWLEHLAYMTQDLWSAAERGPRGDARRQLWRDLTDELVDRDHDERSQPIPTDAELIAWEYLHSQGRAAGLAAADAPIPDPLDSPQLHARAVDALRANPDAMAAAVRSQLEILQSYAEDLPILANWEAASDTDLLQARWLKQALAAEKQAQASASAAPAAEEEVEME